MKDRFFEAFNQGWNPKQNERDSAYGKDGLLAELDVLQESIGQQKKTLETLNSARQLYQTGSFERVCREMERQVDRQAGVYAKIKRMHGVDRDDEGRVRDLEKMTSEMDTIIQSAQRGASSGPTSEDQKRVRKLLELTSRMDEIVVRITRSIANKRR